MKQKLSNITGDIWEAPGNSPATAKPESTCICKSKFTKNKQSPSSTT